MAMPGAQPAIRRDLLFTFIPPPPPLFNSGQQPFAACSLPTGTAEPRCNRGPNLPRPIPLRHPPGTRHIIWGLLVFPVQHQEQPMGDRLGAPRWEPGGLHVGGAGSRSWTSTAEGSTGPGHIALLNSFCSVKARLVSILKAKPAGDGEAKQGWVSGHPTMNRPREPRWLDDTALNPEQQFLGVGLPYGEETGLWAQSWTQRSRWMSHSHPTGRWPWPVPNQHDKIPGELQTAVAGGSSSPVLRSWGQTLRESGGRDESQG